MKDCFQIEIRARTVAQSIRGNYTNTLSPLLPKSTPTAFFHLHFVIEGQFGSSGGPGLGLTFKNSKGTEVTNTHTSVHTDIQYLQQNTEEMDLLSSPDATQREGKQNDGFGRKKEGKTQERTGQGCRVIIV